MSDYYDIINDAVKRLKNNCQEKRQDIYDSARSALISRLSEIELDLSSSEIANYRLMMEDSIKQVEENHQNIIQKKDEEEKLLNQKNILENDLDLEKQNNEDNQDDQLEISQRKEYQEKERAQRWVDISTKKSNIKPVDEQLVTSVVKNPNSSHLLQKESVNVDETEINYETTSSIVHEQINVAGNMGGRSTSKFVNTYGVGDFKSSITTSSDIKNKYKKNNFDEMGMMPDEVAVDDEAEYTGQFEGMLDSYSDLDYLGGVKEPCEINDNNNNLSGSYLKKPANDQNNQSNTNYYRNNDSTTGSIAKNFLFAACGIVGLCLVASFSYYFGRENEGLKILTSNFDNTPKLVTDLGAKKEKNIKNKTKSLATTIFIGNDGDKIKPDKDILTLTENVQPVSLLLDDSSSQGLEKKIDGTVAWKEVFSDKGDRSIVGEVTIDQTKMFKLTITQNKDTSLNASHLLEIKLLEKINGDKGIKKIVGVLAKNINNTKKIFVASARINDRRHWVAFSLEEEKALELNSKRILEANTLEILMIVNGGKRGILVINKLKGDKDIFSKIFHEPFNQKSNTKNNVEN